MAERIAVVTGGNKGIGFEICRQLARKGVKVILTARSRARGQKAVDALQAERLNVVFHALDVTDAESIQVLAQSIRYTYRRCDILVNNAGILINGGSMSIAREPIDIVRETVETNVYGPMQLMQALIPMMKQQNYGRVVNLSSGLGQLTEMGDGYPAYRLSKTALNALTCMFAAAAEHSNVLVNAACPGWVRTDMGGSNATSSVEQGADTAVWLAMLPDSGPSGKLFRNRRRVVW